MTGLPKLLYRSHRRLMMKRPTPKRRVKFNTFPFFHGYGNWEIVHGMMDRKTIHMYDSNLAVNADYVTDALHLIRPDVLNVVPYITEPHAQCL